MKRNGAAARKAQVGDTLIIASYAGYNELEVQRHKPDLVYVDGRNRIKRQGHQIPLQIA